MSIEKNNINDNIIDKESEKDSKFELTSIYKEKTISNNIPFDLNLIDSLETNAYEIADEVNRLSISIKNKLSDISQSTEDAINIQKVSSKKIDKTISESVKQMEKTISLCEEMNKEMSHVYEFSAKVKQIQESLTFFESFLFL